MFDLSHAGLGGTNTVQEKLELIMYVCSAQMIALIKYKEYSYPLVRDTHPVSFPLQLNTLGSYCMAALMSPQTQQKKKEAGVTASFTATTERFHLQMAVRQKEQTDLGNDESEIGSSISSHIQQK